jgi:hypothetical protein
MLTAISADARGRRLLELCDVDVERVELDIDKAQPQAVLLQQVIGRRPGDRRDDDLVALGGGGQLVPHANPRNRPAAFGGRA